MRAPRGPLATLRNGPSGGRAVLGKSDHSDRGDMALCVGKSGRVWMGG